MTAVVEVTTSAAALLLLAALALASARVARGPGIADRALALDLMGFIAIGVIAVLVVRTGHHVLFDAALAVALVSFLASVALARLVDPPASEAPGTAERVSGASG